MNKYYQYQVVSVPVLLIKNQKQLNITDQEMLIMLKLFSYGNQYVVYNVIIKDYQISRSQLAELNEKQLIAFKEIDGNICIDISPLYECMYTLMTNSDAPQEQSLSATHLDRISFLLNRTIKTHELEAIKKWMSLGHELENIELAIQKSIINGVDNFNYIEKVLSETKQTESQQKLNVKRNVEFY